MFSQSIDHLRLEWLINFYNKLTELKEFLEISDEALNSIRNDLKMYQFSLKRIEFAKKQVRRNNLVKDFYAYGEKIEVQETLSDFDEIEVPQNVTPGIFKRISEYVEHLKKTPQFCREIDQSLALYRFKVLFDISVTLEPQLQIFLDGGRPLIRLMNRKADSLDLFVDRKDGRGFVFLANHTLKDFIDTHPIPPSSSMVVWQYIAIFKIAEDQVGNFSDPISINVQREYPQSKDGNLAPGLF
ncbi:hypothetical protein Galf_1817 [Sporocytophaga myxococcoides]|uniref:Uncharacterized protein n=1 Tax=Sporocytophaga myxococcoides TaxID=153721 RepID=A0A098LDH3_9BACT|nr:hypothetical protein [Sporocytophaga myxococcoides]GAL85006.1 hypothetical protein Galf_1817 [Sporocytophaga myxococcoides]